MTETRPPQEPRPEPERPVDELLLRYRQASDADPRRPASQVSEAVRAHAQSVLAARQTVSAVPAAPAANQPRWKLSLTVFSPPALSGVMSSSRSAAG